MLSVITLNVIMVSVVMLNVVATSKAQFNDSCKIRNSGWYTIGIQKLNLRVKS